MKLIQKAIWDFDKPVLILKRDNKSCYTFVHFKKVNKTGMTESEVSINVA